MVGLGQAIAQLDVGGETPGRWPRFCMTTMDGFDLYIECLIHPSTCITLPVAILPDWLESEREDEKNVIVFVEGGKGCTVRKRSPLCLTETRKENM